jgi:hypothetical protein
MAVFDPAFPTSLATPDAVLDGFIKTGVSWGVAVPFFIEVSSAVTLVHEPLMILGQQWSKDETKVAYLRGLKGLVSFSTPLMGSRIELLLAGARWRTAELAHRRRVDKGWCQIVYILWSVSSLAAFSTPET